jgi:adenosylmethionine-8-amino-7-oxononanoate aminotransferase
VVNAAALANLEIIENEGLVGRSASLGPYFKSQLEKLNKHQITGDIRSIGLLAQIDLIKDQNTKEPFGGSNEGRQLTRFMVDNGLYMRCSGHSLNIHPSLIITKDQIDFMVDVFDKTLTYAEQELLTK